MSVSRSSARTELAWFPSAPADHRAPTHEVGPRLASHRLRARRALKCCAVTLLLAALAGGWLVDQCPMRFRFPQAANLVASWKTAQPVPDVLVLGSSRLLWGVDPTRLATRTHELLAPEPPAVFNGSTFGGEPITMDYVGAKLREARTDVPRIVVIELSPDTVARDNLKFMWPITRQMTAADLPRYAPDIILYRDAIPRLLSSRLTPFYRHRGELVAWWTEPFARAIDASAGTQRQDAAILQAPTEDAIPSDGPERSYRRFKKHLRGYELQGSTSETFERMVARFRALGCKIVLVQPPLTTTHRALFGPQIGAQFEPFVRHLRESFACDFVDLGAAVPDSEFSDGDHVNERGRREFTDEFASNVIAPAWRTLADRPAAQ